MIGLYTDKHPLPFSLPFGMAATFVGCWLLAVAGGFATMLLAAALIGIGSSVFHLEASRARVAAGGRYGFAQSVFQVGGNAGQAISLLLVALLVIPNGQLYIAWFALAALIGIGIPGAGSVSGTATIWRRCRAPAARRPPPWRRSGTG